MSTQAATTNITISPNLRATRHNNDQKSPPVVPGDETTFFGSKSGPSFGDMIDIINPLQHIPVVSTLYRHFTGDTIAPAARLAGGAILGGPIGFFVALADTVMQSETGADVGEHAYAMLTGSPTPTQVATAAKPKPEQTAVAESKAAAPQELAANLPPSLPADPDVIVGGTDIPATFGASGPLPAVVGLPAVNLAPAASVANAAALSPLPKLADIPRADPANVNAYSQYYRAQMQATQARQAMRTAF